VKLGVDWCRLRNDGEHRWRAVSVWTKVLCEGTASSDPEGIAEFLKSKACGAVRIGLETGPTSTWLWTELRLASSLH
jgi:hypothetical protein